MPGSTPKTAARTSFGAVLMLTGVTSGNTVRKGFNASTEAGSTPSHASCATLAGLKGAAPVGDVVELLKALAMREKTGDAMRPGGVRYSMEAAGAAFAVIPANATTSISIGRVDSHSTCETAGTTAGGRPGRPTGCTTGSPPP